MSWQLNTTANTMRGTVIEWSPGPKGPSSGMIHGDDRDLYVASEDRLRDLNDLPNMVRGVRVSFTPGKRADGEDHIAKNIIVLP